MTEAQVGSKRKRGDGVKFYAVHVGKAPGVYHAYSDVQEQVKGVPGALFKSFTSLKDAETFVKSGLRGLPKNGPTKFYAVRSGKVPGVYEDWPTAQEQIIGFKAPKYKSFPTRQEAEAFVKGENADANAKAGSRPRRSRAAAAQAPEVDEIDENVVPGTGPLPNGAVDGFDRRLKMNPATGEVEYKTDDELHAMRMVTTGVSKNIALKIFTDGSALSNGYASSRAGVGVYFGPNDPRNLSERLKGPRQTNQRAELTACRKALERAPLDQDVIIYTDSRYSIQCVTEWFMNWRRNNWLTADKKPVENKDLIEPILQRIDQRKLSRANTKFEWVKGHAGDEGNTRADELAREGAEKGDHMDVDT